MSNSSEILSENDGDLDQYFITTNKQTPSIKHRIDSISTNNKITGSFNNDNKSFPNTFINDDINNTMQFNKEDHSFTNINYKFSNEVIDNTIDFRNEHHHNNYNNNNNNKNNSNILKSNSSVQTNNANIIRLIIDNILEFNSRYNIPLSEPWLYLLNSNSIHQNNNIPMTSIEVKQLYLNDQLTEITQFRPIDFFSFNHLPIYHYASISIINDKKWINRVTINPKAKLYLSNEIQSNNSNANPNAIVPSLHHEQNVIFDQSVILHKNDNEILSIIDEDIFEDLNPNTNKKANKQIEPLNESKEWTLVDKKAKIKFKKNNNKCFSINNNQYHQINEIHQQQQEQQKQQLYKPMQQQQQKQQPQLNKPMQQQQPSNTPIEKQEWNYEKEFQQKMKEKQKKMIENKQNDDNYIKAFGEYYPITHISKK